MKLRVILLLVLSVMLSAQADAKEVRIPISKLDELTPSELTNEFHRLTKEIDEIQSSYNIDHFGPYTPSPPTPDEIKENLIVGILTQQIVRWRALCVRNRLLLMFENSEPITIPFGDSEMPGASLVRDASALLFTQDGPDLLVQFPIRRWSEGGFALETTHAAMGGECFLLFRIIYVTEPKGIKIGDVVSWRIPSMEQAKTTFFLKQYPDLISPPKRNASGTNTVNNALQAVPSTAPMYSVLGEKRVK